MKTVNQPFEPVTQDNTSAAEFQSDERIQSSWSWGARDWNVDEAEARMEMAKIESIVSDDPDPDSLDPGIWTEANIKQEPTTWIEEKHHIEVEGEGINSEPCQREAEKVVKNEIVIRHPKKISRKPVQTYMCELCHIGLPDKDLFVEHMNNVHGDKYKFPCSFCGKKFAQEQHRKRHETIHDVKRFEGSPKFACDLCDQKYHLKSSLASHKKMIHFGYDKLRKQQGIKTSNKAIIREHHAIGVRPPQRKKVKTFYNCPKCDLKFDMRCLLKKHMLCHSDVREHKCKFCGQPCKSKSSLSLHIRNVHVNPSNGPRRSRPKYMSGQPCPCEYCGKVYTIPSRLRLHLVKHTGEKRYTCSICHNKFGTPSLLKTHMRRHQRDQNELNKFKCIFCGKNEFLVFSNLFNHLRSHENIANDRERYKPFACGICAKPYYTPAGATICTLLRHDPTTLRDAMFKFKCRACPEERLGYYCLAKLRQHWEDEHSEFPIPVEYRAGMYQNFKFQLPSVTISKKKVEDIRNGLLPDTTDLGVPLYVELDLIPVEPKKPKEMKRIESKCRECHLTLNEQNLKRHMNDVHGLVIDECGNVVVEKSKFRQCTDCGMRFAKAHTLKKHWDVHHGQNNELSTKSKMRTSFTDGSKPEKCLKCSECLLAFNFHSVLRKHMETIHGFLIDDKGNILNEDGEFQPCPICRMRFSMSYNLKRHLNAHHKPKHETGTNVEGTNHYSLRKSSRKTSQTAEVVSTNLDSNGRSDDDLKSFIDSDDDVVELLHKCRVCEKPFPTRKAAWCHELQTHHRRRKEAIGNGTLPSESNGTQCISYKETEGIRNDNAIPESNSKSYLHKCKVCSKSFPSVRAAWCHELQAHHKRGKRSMVNSATKIDRGESIGDVSESIEERAFVAQENIGVRRVNLNDVSSVNELLGFKVLRVTLTKIDSHF